MANAGAMTFPPDRARLQDIPRRLGLAAIVAMSPENFAYASGAFILTVSLVRPRQAFVIIPAQGEPVLVVCSIEKALTQSESWIEDIRTYVEFVDHPIDALCATLRSLGIEKGQVGCDLDYLPVTSHRRFVSQLPTVELVDTSAAIAAVRAIKTPEQVAFLQRTTRQTHRAALDAMAESRLGDSERDMANRIVSRLIHKGADGTLFVCFSSGPRTAQAHAHATDRVPQPGEIIRFDFGGTYGAWSSDFARTYATADPSELQRSTYAKLREIHVATIEMVRPGILAEDVFWFCRRLYEKHGLPAHQAHIGHGFGLELHETPMLRPGDKTPLQEGMVLNIEPSVFDDERSCYHVEDLFVVTQGGPRLLTLGYPPPELPELSQVLDYPE